MERQESQRKQIQEWLEKGNFITPMLSLEMFGCFRLSAIIYNLKYDYGMDIKTEMIYGPKHKRYA